MLDKQMFFWATPEQHREDFDQQALLVLPCRPHLVCYTLAFCGDSPLPGMGPPFRYFQAFKGKVKGSTCVAHDVETP